MNASAIKQFDITDFDVADYLDNEEMIATYLSEILADGDMDELLEAISEVARARGMSELAKASGLGRESLYKALRPGAVPRFETLRKVLGALGVNLQAVPKHRPTERERLA